MQLSFEVHALVERLAVTSSFAEAMSIMPEDWELFVTGAAHPSWAGACTVTFTPPGLPDDHMLMRLANEGMNLGLGHNRHEALVAACRFVLRRCSKIEAQPSY